MKMIALVTLGLAVGSSAGQAEELAASLRAEGTHFAAMSLADGQGVRAIVSNVLARTGDTDLAPCQVQVSFFGTDGTLIDSATTVQLKAGESTSVSASHPSKLVRATVSIRDAVNPANLCALKTSLEVYDERTSTTFVTVPGEFVGSNSACSLSIAQPLGAARKNITARAISAPVPASAILSARPAPRKKPASPVLASTPPTASTAPR
jgi:hypothetical protein